MSLLIVEPITSGSITFVPTTVSTPLTVRYSTSSDLSRLIYRIGLIEQMENISGVKFYEAQVALARQWMAGDNITGQREIVICEPQEESLFPSDKPQVMQKVTIPQDERAAREMVERFERASANVRNDDSVSDSVCQHALADNTSLGDEVWLGSKQEELYA